jgi:hypothetical protein
MKVITQGNECVIAEDDGMVVTRATGESPELAVYKAVEAFNRTRSFEEIRFAYNQWFHDHGFELKPSPDCASNGSG